MLQYRCYGTLGCFAELCSAAERVVLAQLVCSIACKYLASHNNRERYLPDYLPYENSMPRLLSILAPSQAARRWMVTGSFQASIEIPSTEVAVPGAAYHAARILAR